MKQFWNGFAIGLYICLIVVSIVIGYVFRVIQ